MAAEEHAHATMPQIRPWWEQRADGNDPRPGLSRSSVGRPAAGPSPSDPFAPGQAASGGRPAVATTGARWVAPRGSRPGGRRTSRDPGAADTAVRTTGASRARRPTPAQRRARCRHSFPSSPPRAPSLPAGRAGDVAAGAARRPGTNARRFPRSAPNPRPLRHRPSTPGAPRAGPPSVSRRGTSPRRRPSTPGTSRNSWRSGVRPCRNRRPTTPPRSWLPGARGRLRRDRRRRTARVLPRARRRRSRTGAGRHGARCGSSRSQSAPPCSSRAASEGAPRSP